MKPMNSLIALGLAALVSHASTVPALAGAPFSFEEAKATAAATDRPLLLRVGGAWCVACNTFDKAFDNDDALRTGLADRVVFAAVDIKEDGGSEVGRIYSVGGGKGLTFILANSAGEVMDRWQGFYDTKGFLEHLNAALENPITVDERIARFREHPNEIDARKLAELRDYEGYHAEAIAYYRRAQALNPASDTNYDLLVLFSMSRGVGSGLYGAPEVKTQADVVVASATSKPEHLLKVAYNMGKIAKKEGDSSYFTPYLRVAVERTEGIEDEKVQTMRSNLLPEYALLVKDDVEQAVAYKKAAFAQAAEPHDWLENANMLNNFSWWCFENQINLAEAETYARKGIELAKAGRQKANILDTLAEVCNLKGDCGSAVEYIKLAVAEDPENEYFQKQLKRFEALLADAHGAHE